MSNINNRLITYTIYLITNNIDGRNYVGKHKVKRREKLDSREYMGSGSELKRDQEKLGLENFSKELLAICYSEEEENILETQYIALYRSIGKAEYNIADGGEGGCSNPEIRAKISKKCKESYEGERGEKRKEFLCELRKTQNPMGTKEAKQKRKESMDEYWNSEEGQRQRKINSKRNKSLAQTKGYHWYNNGVKDTVAKECPEGFVPGRINTSNGSEKRSQSRKNWWNSLSDEERKAHTKKVADGHRGKSKSDTCKANISKANKGRKYYNNGVIEIMQFECPEGFVPGRCPKAKESISKGMTKR